MADPDARPSPISRSLATRFTHLLGVAALVVAIVLTRSPGATVSPAAVPLQTTSAGVQASPPEITVIGVGAVHGTPDTLNVQMDVASQATHASDALSQDESETNSLIQTLSGSGVNQSDIQTASLSIDPIYGSDGQSITGYQVDETVAVTLRDLSTAGTVLDAAARSVGDDIRIQSMALSISDISSLMARARAQAMADAKTKAGQLASGAGVALGPIVSITDNTQTSTTPPISYAVGAPEASSAVPVQAGSEQLSVSVSVVYQLGG
jgi:uncharacterized protein YggE